jgi:hypothetical protein
VLGYSKEVKRGEYEGQVDLANRRIQPLCHLSAARFQQLTTVA